jgi:hypothetical protein
MITGSVDDVHEPFAIIGWACNLEDPFGPPLRVEAHLNGELIGEAEAKYPRPDLANIGHGRHAFCIECPGGFNISALRSNALRIVAKSADAEAEIVVHESVLQGRDIAAAVAGMLGLRGDLLLRAFKQISQSFSPGRLAATTTVTIPAGITSLDSTAMLGTDGFGYLTGGTNNVLARYRAEPQSPEVQSCVAAWAELIFARAAWCAENGIIFRQLIIPEKLAVYPQFAPVPLPPMSPHLAQLESKLRSENVHRDAYVSALDLLAEASKAGLTFGKVGTHLTPLGAHAVVRGLLGSFGLAIPELVLIETRTRESELGDRFFGLPMYEEVLFPRADGLGLSVPTVVHRKEAQSHVGTELSWVCPDAPIDMKVVAFANSFFGTGVDETQLCWWMARLFREFHFFWEPEFDRRVVERLKPDVVFGQTIERFLGLVPLG